MICTIMQCEPCVLVQQLSMLQAGSRATNCKCSPVELHNAHPHAAALRVKPCSHRSTKNTLEGFLNTTQYNTIDYLRLDQASASHTA